MTIILHFSCTAMCHWSIVGCLANRTYMLHHIFSVIWNDRDHGWLELLKQKGFCQCYQQRSSDWVLLMLSPWIQNLPVHQSVTGDSICNSYDVLYCSSTKVLKMAKFLPKKVKAENFVWGEPVLGT